MYDPETIRRATVIANRMGGGDLPQRDPVLRRRVRSFILHPANPSGDATP